MRPADQLQIVPIKYTGNWNSRPYAPLVWSQEIRFRTSIDVRWIGETGQGLLLTDPSLFDLPLAILSGDLRFRLSGAERSSLKKWIEAGGFLIIDGAGQSRPSASFHDSVGTELDALFPGRPLVNWRISCAVSLALQARLSTG